MEDDQNGRRPKWKMTKMEEKKNGKQLKIYKNQELCNTKKCGAIYMSAFAAFFRLCPHNVIH